MLDQGQIMAYLEKEVTFVYSRSSGPGGQNVNKVNSKVTLYWAYLEAEWLDEACKNRLGRALAKRINMDGFVTIYSQRHRSQTRNIEDCISKLAEAIVPLLSVDKPRKATKPSRGSKERRLQGKKQQGEKKRWRGKIDY